MYIAKQEQTHRYREETLSYQIGEGSGEGQDKHMGLRNTNYYV